jgi:PAS domain S-box-containing protein
MSREGRRPALQDIDDLFLAKERLEAEIAQRRKIEESLREIEERLRRMVEMAHDGVVSIDENGRVIAWNAWAERIFGWSGQEAMGAVLADLVIPPEYREAHWAGIQRYISGTGQSKVFNRRVELQALHRNGSRIPVELSIWPVTSGGRPTFSAFVRDLSEHKRSERATEARAGQIRLHRNMLLDLARLDKPEFGEALRHILSVSAATLGVERVGYWTLSPDRSTLTCEMLVTNSTGQVAEDETGLTIAARDYPGYFSALGRSKPIIASDAAHHVETMEFAREYLPTHGITSMLDASVWFRGVMVGVVCHEHVGPARVWTAEEVDFASAIATMIALSLERSTRHGLVEALRHSEQRYRHVVDYAGEAIVVAQEGMIRFANPRCEAISGYSMAELQATPFINLVHPDDRKRVGENYQKRLAGLPAEDRYAFRVVRKTGEIVMLELSAVRIEWEGRPATLNFLSDITERSQLQQRLGETLLEREAILETAVVGIVFIQNGVVRWINSILEQRMLGYEKGELIGQRGETTFPSQEDWARFLGECVPALERGEVFETEMRVRRRDGSLFWCIFSGRAIDARDIDRGSIWSMVDISERRRAEDEVRRALEKEKELNELKSRFVSMTSHEFRTPLAAILSSTELLEDYGDRMDKAERAELMSNVKGAVRRMTEMLDQVLLIGKVDAGRMEYNPEALKIREFCSALLDELRSTATPAHRLTLDFRSKARHALMDPQLLRRILANLLANAIKYSPEGGEVSLTVTSTKDEIGFAISDEGIGIPQADHARLFEAFHRGRNIGNISGTGLGLSIVKRCVDLHHGTITFRSEAGKGSRFEVRIPIRDE